MELDASLYPDLDVPPTRLDQPEEKADYLHRVCSAMDFHIFPERATHESAGGVERHLRSLSAAGLSRLSRPALVVWLGRGGNSPDAALRPPYLAMDAAEGGTDCKSMI